MTSVTATAIVAVAPCGCIRIALAQDERTKDSDRRELYRKAAVRCYEVRNVSLDTVRNGRFACDLCRRAPAPVQSSLLEPRS